MIVREAKIEDWESISQLMGELQDIHAKHYPTIFKKGARRGKEYFTKTLSEPTKRIFVAENNETIVGFIKGKIITEKESETRFERVYGYMDSIYVLVSYRGLFVDQKLFAKLFQWFRENNINYAEGGVWEFNEEARQVFEQMGSVTYQRKQFIDIEIK